MHIRDLQRLPDYHYVIRLLMDSDYCQFYIPGDDDEEYCAQVLEAQDPSFRDVITGYRGVPIDDDLIWLWHRAISNYYEGDIDLPYNPLDVPPYLEEMGEEMGIETFLSAYIDKGIGVNDLILAD